MVTYSRNAAKGIVRKDGRIARVEYRGPIGLECFADLVGSVISTTSESASVLVRMDKATFLLAEPPPVHKVLNGLIYPPAILVVEPRQYELWSDYAKNLANAGVSCAIFANSQLELAERLARTLTAE